MKTSELHGTALDWAVAKCEEVELIKAAPGQMYVYSKGFGNPYAPSRACADGWNIAGPIIEREKIDVRTDDYTGAAWLGEKGVLSLLGPTPLIAAMRCYVASKLGDDVEIPEELL